MNDEQLLRYSRQIMLGQMDVAGQQKLLEASVLVIGLGGLGCPAAMYLASAGVGRLILADDDEVELTNLQRQIAHKTTSIGSLKVNSAAATLAELNPDVRVECIARRLHGEDLEQVIAGVDVVLDATDNFTTRFAVNRCCVAHRVPLVSGAAIRMEGQISVFDSRQENCPCYQCLYEAGEDVELSCSQSGVMAPLVGIIGTMQAMETIKLICGIGTTLAGRLLLLDAVNMQFRELHLKKNPSCPVCARL